MTVKEAIEEIKNASDREVSHGDVERHFDDVMKRVEAFKMAISALEKQEGKKPLPHVEMFECENCGNVIMPYDDYCYRCGQRIDWINEHGID